MVSTMLMPLASMIAQTFPAATPEPGSPLSAVARSCAAGPTADGEVLVCARPRDADRLKPMAPLAPERHADPLAFRLPGGGTGRVHAFQRDMPGATSQGVAVTAILPLGRTRRADGENR